jgi:hypothetical protein
VQGRNFLSSWGILLTVQHGISSTHGHFNVEKYALQHINDFILIVLDPENYFIVSIINEIT